MNDLTFTYRLKTVGLILLLIIAFWFLAIFFMILYLLVFIPMIFFKKVFVVYAYYFLKRLNFKNSSKEESI